MRKLMLLIGALGAVAAGTLVAWRRNPRLGSGFMNGRVDPFLVRRGWSGGGRAEIGTLEHFGRRTGTRHLTPVHPEPIADGYRIVVPLGLESQWARNVLAAGHCRLELHGVVHDLDEPAILLPREMSDLPGPVRPILDSLGFRYLRLHRFAQRPGSLLEPVATEPRPTAEQPAAPDVIAAPAEAGV